MSTVKIANLLAKSSVAALILFSVGMYIANSYNQNMEQKNDTKNVADIVKVERHSVVPPTLDSSGIENKNNEKKNPGSDDSNNVVDGVENLPDKNDVSADEDVDSSEEPLAEQIVDSSPPAPIVAPTRSSKKKPAKVKKTAIPAKEIRRSQKPAVPRVVASKPAYGSGHDAPVAKNTPPPSPAKSEIEPEEEFIELVLPTVTLNEQRGLLPDIPEVPSVLSSSGNSTAIDPEAYEDDDIGMDIETVSTNGLSDDLILDVYLRNTLVYQGLFCQFRDGKVYYPLSEIFGILGFPIEINAKGAHGWYIRENRKFEFESKSGHLLNNGFNSTLPYDSFFYYEDELFMEHSRLQSVFPINFNLDVSALLVNIIPREYLPMELRKIRQDQHYIYKVKNSLKYPLQDLDYAAIAPPRLDAQLSMGYSKSSGGRKRLASSVAGHYRGDLLYMSTSLYGTAAYNIDEDNSDLVLDNFSLSAERQIQDNPYISKVTIGDIVPSTTPFGSGGSLERGVRVTNKKISSSSEYETKTITGKTMPGWDVELYRNNQLVGFQTVGQDGTYLFENVELHYGNNRFKLILYGREGQEEIREEVVTIGSSMLAGDVEYDFSASQQGIGVFDEKYSEVKPSGSNEDGSGRFKAAVNVGLGRGIALRTGVIKDKFDNKDRVVGSVGLSGGYEGVLGQVDVGHSTTGSTQIKSTVRTQLDGGASVNISGSYQFSDEYKESSIKNSIVADYSDSKDLSESVLVSYGGSLGRTHSHNESNGDSIYYDLSGNVGLFSEYGYLSNNIGVHFYEQTSSGEEPLFYGTSTYYKSFKGGSVRGNIDYGINKEDGAHLKTMGFAANYRLTKKASTSLSLNKYLVGGERFTASNTWSYTIDKFTPFLQGTWSDDSSHSVFLGLSLSMDIDQETYLPHFSGGGAKNGGASCLVFDDRNYNDRFDEGDKPIKDVILKAHQGNRETITDNNGRALFYNLDTHQSTDISVDYRSVEDLRLTTDTGVAITPRPGKIYDLEFPLHVTGIVEGYAYIISDDQAKGKPMVPVQLVDNTGEVVATSWTEQDGFFVIEHVLPGEYSVQIDEAFLGPKEYAAIPSSPFTITKDGEDVRGTYLFYGKEKNVAILGDKFKSKMQFGDDVLSYTDYSNLDEPAEDDLWDPARIASSILGNAANKNTAIADSDSKSKVAAAPKDESENMAKPKEDQSNIFKKHALILDTFVSEKSAIRAVSHYRQKQKAALQGCTLSHRKFKDAYVVVVRGIQDESQLYKITNLFMCEPRLIAIN